MAHSPSLVVHLEAPYGQYVADVVPAREVILMAFDWTTPYWPTLAVGWLEQGAPMDDEIAIRLDAICGRSESPQNLRHRARALVMGWRKASFPQ